MKKFSLSVFLLASLIIKSQTAPQWLFPIWFEDANGDRDTVYIGYDPDANLLGFDEEFEDYNWIDTAKFNALVFYGNPSPYSGNYVLDSAKKIEISSYIYPDIVVDFVKGQMPISMHWDMSLLYSESLPYINQFPYPNAVAFVYCGAGEPGYVNCPNAFDDDPLTMTDSVNIYYQYPITSPHLFDGSGESPTFDEPEEVLDQFGIYITPYNVYTEINTHTQDIFDIYPNPFKNFIKLNFSSKYFEPKEIKIRNLLGENISKYNTNETSIVLSLSDVDPGVYILTIRVEDKELSSIIIKQ